MEQAEQVILARAVEMICDAVVGLREKLEEAEQQRLSGVKSLTVDEVRKHIRDIHLNCSLARDN